MAFNETKDQESSATLDEWLTPEASARLAAADPAELVRACVLAVLGDAKPLAAILIDDPSKCKRCHVPLVKGQALLNTLAGIPDFPGDNEASTVSRTGPPKMVDVLKCPECGYSRTP